MIQRFKEVWCHISLESSCCLNFWIIYWNCLMAKHLLFDFIIGKSINQYAHNWVDGLQYIISSFSWMFILHGIYFDSGQFRSMIERFSPHIHEQISLQPINFNKRYMSNKSMCWKDNFELNISLHTHTKHFGMLCEMKTNVKII